MRKRKEGRFKGLGNLNDMA